MDFSLKMIGANAVHDQEDPNSTTHLVIIQSL